MFVVAASKVLMIIFIVCAFVIFAGIPSDKG